MEKIDLFKRIESGFIDFISLGILGVPVVLMDFIFKLESNMMFQSLAFSFLISYFLCKDLIQAKSIGKRIVNLRIVGNLQTEVSPIRLILRNIFVAIWPIELIFCLINPEKKLGDIVFGTKVVLDEGKIQPIDIKKPQILLYFIIILTLIFFIIHFSKLISIQNNSVLQLLYN